MSPHLFLFLVLLLAVGGFGGGFLLGTRTSLPAVAGATAGAPASATAEADLATAAEAGDRARLRSISERARGTPLGARADLALVRGQPSAAQAAAQQAFLQRYPASWLRTAWSSSSAGRGAR